MKAVIVLVLVLVQSMVVSANPYSFIGSFLDQKNYQEFIQGQQAIEQSCGLIYSTYFNTYGEELVDCEVVSFDGRQFVLAQGPQGELSRSELAWLKHNLNIHSQELKLNFIMGEYSVRSNLVSKPSVIFEIQLLF